MELVRAVCVSKIKIRDFHGASHLQLKMQPCSIRSEGLEIKIVCRDENGSLFSIVPSIKRQASVCARK